MLTRILFVDDDLHVLSGLRRMLHPLRAEWNVSFASSAEEALHILEDQPHDIIVSDMRMPGMDGAQLLTEVRRLYPDMVRIILSGHSDHDMILRSIGPTHQYLTKPCDPDVLNRTIRRSVALRNILSDPRIKVAVAAMDTLPSMPALYIELIEELQKPSCSSESIGEIIARDVGMTAQILHLVNSAFFGLQREISNPAAAVTYLGLTTLTALVMTFHIFRELDESYRSWLGVEQLWQHSMNAGAVAKAIARAETSDRKLVDDAFSAGLLHDAGRLVLACGFPDRYRGAIAEAAARRQPLVDVELELFGVTHAEIGAYLLSIWGLPNSITEALAYHHRPQDSASRSFCPMIAVHAACSLDHAPQRHGTALGDSPLAVDYLREIGLEDRIEAWTTLAEKTLALKETSTR